MPTQNLATSTRKFQHGRKPSWGTSGGAAGKLFEQLGTRRLGMQSSQNNLSKLAALATVLENIYDAKEAMSGGVEDSATFLAQLSLCNSCVPCPIPENHVSAAAATAFSEQTDIPKNYAASMLLP